MILGVVSNSLASSPVVISKDEHAPHAARVSASIIDRAYGKAPTNTTQFKRAIDMTDDELAAIVGRAKLTLVKSDT